MFLTTCLKDRRHKRKELNIKLKTNTEMKASITHTTKTLKLREHKVKTGLRLQQEMRFLL